MKAILLMFSLSLSMLTIAQEPQKYQNKRDETHLCGPIKISDLQSDTYREWFDENYSALNLEGANKWKKNLKGKEIEIYLGTWCGDSKKWVPRFIKLWDELGLDRSQLKIVALYDGSEKYKQGPNREERGKNIHRVPTFIFKDNGQEYARIVESPATDLATDLAQIALGYPSSPNYKGANFMMSLLNNNSKDEIYEDFKTHLNKAYRLTGKKSEFNTLGYVYLQSDRINEALTVFHFNTYYFPKDPNVFDSYAEALESAGDIENAIINYKKVLELDSEHENAIEQLAKLETGS